MTIKFKMTGRLYRAMQHDLVRPHPFAAERVGFISCRVGALLPEGLIILAHEYHPVNDADYLNDEAVGAMMGPAAIRKALQFAYNNPVSMFHVHMHEHVGRPAFSRIDRNEHSKFVPDFWHVRPEMPHGALVLSTGSASGICWYPGISKPIPIENIKIVSASLRVDTYGNDI